MKKIFEYIGLLSVVCFSFFMTDKTINVARQMDNIMIDIKNNKDDYKVFPIEPVINEGTLIPGINGIEVNVNKSYTNMKSIGIYDPSLYIYNTVKVNKEIKHNLDKYITGGNVNKNMISIIINIEDIDIETFLSKIGNYKFNFVVSNYYLENNEEIIINLINNGHNILINQNDISSIDIYKKNIQKYNQQNLYCLMNEKNSNNLDICSTNKVYSILTNNVIKNNYLLNIKKELKGGIFIAISGDVSKYIVNIVNYIVSKGYNIENLDNHLNETML